MTTRFSNRNGLAGALLAGAAIVACVSLVVERAAAFRGGFGGFHGGGGFHFGNA